MHSREANNSKEKIDDLKYQFDIIKKENMKKYEA